MFRGERAVSGEGALLAILDLVLLEHRVARAAQLEHVVRLTESSNLRRGVHLGALEGSPHP